MDKHEIDGQKSKSGNEEIASKGTTKLKTESTRNFSGILGIEEIPVWHSKPTISDLSLLLKIPHRKLLIKPGRTTEKILDRNFC